MIGRTVLTRPQHHLSSVRVVRPAYLWDTRGIVYGFAGVWGRARARGGRREEVTRS